MKIEMTKEVVFKTEDGTVLKVYVVGQVIENVHKAEHYYVTPMGGIWLDEVKEVD